MGKKPIHTLKKKHIKPPKLTLRHTMFTCTLILGNEPICIFQYFRL